MLRVWAAGLCASVLFLLAGPVSADLQNGHFTEGVDGLDGWDATPFVLEGQATQQVGDYNPYGTNLPHVLRMDAWNDPGDTWFEASTSQYIVTPDENGRFVPAGTTALSFYGAGDPSIPTGASWPLISVSVTYVDTGGNPQTDFYDITEGDSAWRLRTLNLLSPLDPYEIVTVQMSLSGDSIPADETLTAVGYFDDFKFVPEPMTMTALGLGAVLGLLRRRR